MLKPNTSTRSDVDSVRDRHNAEAAKKQQRGRVRQKTRSGSRRGIPAGVVVTTLEIGIKLKSLIGIRILIAVLLILFRVLTLGDRRKKIAGNTKERRTFPNIKKIPQR